MTHSFILIMLYFQARVQVFKRNGGNGNKTEGGRDTAGSRGSRMVGIYIRKSYYIMYNPKHAIKLGAPKTSGPPDCPTCSSVTDELVAVVRHSPSLTDELYGELPLE